MLSICVCGLAGGQPGTRCRRQCSGRTRGRTRPTWLSVLPSFRPAAALGALPAGGEAVESQASAAPLSPANHHITFAQDPGRRKRAAKDRFGPDWFIFLTPALPKSRSMCKDGGGKMCGASEAPEWVLVVLDCAASHHHL